MDEDDIPNQYDQSNQDDHVCTYGMVLRLPISMVPELVEFVKEMGAKIVIQRVSSDYLFINSNSNKGQNKYFKE